MVTVACTAVLHNTCDEKSSQHPDYKLYYTATIVLSQGFPLQGVTSEFGIDEETRAEGNARVCGITI